MISLTPLFFLRFFLLFIYMYVHVDVNEKKGTYLVPSMLGEKVGYKKKKKG